MKKSLIAGLVASAIAVPAAAQTSVTLYGVIDQGLDFTNNVAGSKSYSMQSGYVQGSRWGLKGAEDLGGGLKAVFQLENGYNLSNGRLGQGGLMFGRQAYVGIASSQFGTVTLGRQYDSVVDYLAQVTANGNWGGYIFSHPYDNDNTDNSFRFNNSIKYTSPTFGGLQFGGAYSFSNDTNFANNRAYSVGAQYTAGGLLLAAAYLEANNPSANASGAINNAGDLNFLANKLRVFGAGASYQFGPANIALSYTNSYITNPTTSGYVGNIVPGAGSLSNLRFQNFEINAKYDFTPAFYVGAMYTYTKADFNTTAGKLNPNYQMVGLMADYFLSKRTDLYAQAGYQHVGGDRTGSVMDFGFVPGADGVSSTQNQVVARVAIRHKF
jgi:predicted porin